MKVTPVKKSFNRHKVGEVFDLPDASARMCIKLGLVARAPTPVVVAAPVVVPEPEPVVEDEEKAAPVYETRMLTAERVATVSAAPAKRPYVRRNPPK